MKVVARPRKGAGGVAAPTRDKLPVPAATPLRVTKETRQPAPEPAPRQVPVRGYPAPTFEGEHSDPFHFVKTAARALLHGTQSPAERRKEDAWFAAHGGRPGGDSVFSPATLVVDQLIHAPEQIRAAHELAVRIAHPSHENPPSLKQSAEGLLGGAFGFPAMRVKEGTVEPFHAFPRERVSTNLRSKLNPRNARRGLPANPTLKQGGQVVLGPITPSQWVKRVESVFKTPAERDEWAHWYEKFAPAFRRAFGDQADEVMRGFAVSQANASPTSGLQAVLRVMDKLRRGEQVGADEISAVAPAIAKAVQGQEVDKGIAAKLSDFIDSLRGKDTRTWMGDAAEGGQPAAIDVHALRDQGFVDQKLVGKLAKRGLLPFEHFVVDSPGVAKGPMYERTAERYGKIADHLNRRRYDGRSDWTPAQAQALGWGAIQKFHGVEPENLDKALEMNSRDFLSTSIGDGHKLAQIAHEEGGFVQPSSVRTRLSVIASPEKHRVIAQRMADESGQRVAMLRRNTSKGRRGYITLTGSDVSGAAEEIVSRILGDNAHVHVTGRTADLIKAKGKLSNDERALAESIAARHGAQVSFGHTELEVFDGRSTAGAGGDLPGRAANGGGVPRVAASEAGGGAADAGTAAGGAEGSVGPLETTASGGPEGARRVQSVLDANAGDDLVGLPTKVKNKVGELRWHSWREAQDTADAYMQDARLPYDPPRTYAKVDPERARRIAAEYEQMLHAPNDPEVAAAYQAMIDETLAQYREIEKTGVTFEFYPGYDPYPAGPRDSVFDLIRNKHMYVFPTESGFGTELEIVDHPLLADSGIEWGGKRVTHNDLFRAVHDYFGHAKEGVGFRADGEENAWRSHSAMYSPAARRAMTTETRGQNSWVNFGPHGEANRTASQIDTVYADQKAGLLPEWVTTDGAGDTAEQRASAQFAGRSDAELHARLGELTGRYNELVDKLAAAEGRPGDYKSVTARQNVVNGKSMKRGRGRVYKDVSVQLRDLAESKLQQTIDANPDDPTVRALTAELDEAHAISRELAARADAHLGITDTPPAGMRSVLADETGSVDPFAFLPDHSGPYEPRTLTHNELTAQLPKSRSRITQPLERAVDSASRALQKSKLIVDTPVARIVTAGERVAKAAGRAQRIETSRRQAQMLEDLNAISDVKAGSPEDVGNFWYAQLPSEYRNADGLALIRGKQATELEYITSGKALEDLGKRETAVKIAMSEAETNGEAMRHLRELEEIKVLKTDLPQRVDDVTASLGELDKLIADPPPVNEAAIQAADNLARDRERILVESGRLDPERAANRKGLLSGWLGLEPTGEETYIGHRLPKPEGFKGSFMPSGGTGRVKSPQGLGRENKLVLASTGRLRQSLRVAAEDWHSAQVFEQANVARGDLAALGTKFEGHVPEGHVLVNPKGRTIPAHWKTDELAQFHDGYDDVEHIREQAKEILDGFVATDRNAFEQMKQDALEQGVSWDELRVVPKRLLDRYYAQFRSSKARGTGAKIYDAGIDAVASSIVFARVGYIPKNFVQNLIMAVPHQGAFLPLNAVRAGQVMRDARLRHLIHGEIGFTGATGALGKEAAFHRVLGTVAGAVSKVADDPVRIAAFLHEAAAEGVISKVRPLLNDEDRQALIRLLTSKSERTRLNDIRSRTVDAMADFSRMTPDQARAARRFLIIPGWLMAGSRYPFHFAATHPIRTALLAYIAMGEPGAPPALQFNQPINTYFTGTQYRQGIQTRYGRLRTGSLSPVNTPWDLGLAAVQTARGKTDPHDFSQSTAIDFAQPLAAAGISLAEGEGPKKSLLRLAPNYSFAEGMVHPSASPTYPEDRTRLGRLKREIGIVPIDVNDPAGKKTAADREHARLEPVRKAFGSVPPEVRAAENTRSAYFEAEKALKHDHGVDGLSEREQVKLKLQILAASHPELASTVDQLRATVDDNLAADVYASVNRWAEQALGWDVADRFESEAKQVAAHGG